MFRAPRFPRAGESLLAYGFKGFPGGKGANQAVAIARLGGEVRFIGAVGEDAFGLLLRQSLQEAGVDVSDLRLSDCEASGCAAVVVDDQGRNQIVVAPGANMGLSAEAVTQALEGGEGPVLTQLEIPPEAVIACARSARRFILNPAPARELEDSVLAGCFLITPNETETEILTGIFPTEEDTCMVAAGVFLSRGVQNVVITLGERGCFWTDGSTALHVPAPRVKAVDTVGAGDAFNGALSLFLAEGRDWPNALALANHYAALSVTRAGAQASLPTRAELQAFSGQLY